ncbi:MAG: hypothetical protein EXQ74_07235 [Thermoleophilia bacterium]|nr:hypothetical protein [Thermoleophilia bacterium]
MPYTDEFDAVLAGLAPDWAFLECRLTVDDPLRLVDARVALARANGRPERGESNHDFAITVANTHGRGARAGVVRSALRTLDDLGVTGRLWAGDANDSLRPAPAHRYGP